MKNFIVCILIFGFLSCKEDSGVDFSLQTNNDSLLSQSKDSVIIPKEIDSLILKPSDLPYKKMLSSIKKSKEEIKKLDFDENLVSQKFESFLVDSIFPYWYGTSWDFNGYTATPNKGTIACGYFVSTTLLHAGISLNRYDMAKKSPEDEANYIQCEDSILTFSNDSLELIFDSMYAKLNDGIYFLGFSSSHVGFLYKKEGQLWVIHSNPIGENGVEAETIEDCEYFAFYRDFIVLPISRNKNLMRKWLNSEKITA